MQRGSFIAAALVLSGTALPLSAASVVREYQCERAVRLPVVFVSEQSGSGTAVLFIEGNLVNLDATPAASGVRYAGSPDLSGYVWWTKGDAALLTWYDAATGQETPIYSECATS